MKILFLCTGYTPYYTKYGVAVTEWSHIQQFRRRGHEVSVVVLKNETPNDTPTEEIEALKSIGCDVMAMGPLSKLNPSYIAEYVTSNFTPDILFAYTTGALAYGKAFDCPKVCAMVDLDHHVEMYRRQYVYRSVPIGYGELAQLHNRAMELKDASLKVLRTADLVIEHAKHHSDWLNSQGIKSEYVPMPVVDPKYEGWRREWEYVPNNPKPRILLAGHLNGIATMSGLYFLAEDILPHLDVESYDIHICGADNLPPDLAARFKPYGDINWRGYVDDIHSEMLQADIFLCPTPIDLGFRTRLAETMGLGCCIVAHSANGLGMPEAIHGENIAFHSNGKGMAQCIKTLSKYLDMRRRLGDVARETYEEHFIPPKAAGKVADLMEELV